ncbi:MAG: hypothetical protein ACYSUN_10190, partial [Planctomycetota bacterium]
MRKAIIVCVLLALSGLLALLALDKSGEAPQRSAEKTVTVEIEEEQESPEPAASGDIQDLLENDLGEAPPPEAVEEAAKMARGIRERARRTLERADAIAAAQVARRIKEEREAAE